ncbi:MAG: DNA-formamidopyrimidine glycosylase family protein [Smithella sp.]
MPELPEVETLSRQLRNIISGRKILSSKVYDHKLVNIKIVRVRRVMTVECNSKMIKFFSMMVIPYQYLCARRKGFSGWRMRQSRNIAIGE